MVRYHLVPAQLLPVDLDLAGVCTMAPTPLVVGWRRIRLGCTRRGHLNEHCTCGGDQGHNLTCLQLCGHTAKLPVTQSIPLHEIGRPQVHMYYFYVHFRPFFLVQKGKFSDNPN